MLCSQKSVWLNRAAAGAAIGACFAFCGAALSQTSEDQSISRGVRIIGAPPDPPKFQGFDAATAPALTPLAPSPATPALLAPASPAPALSTAQPPLLTPTSPSQSAITASPALHTPAAPSSSVGTASAPLLTPASPSRPSAPASPALLTPPAPSQSTATASPPLLTPAPPSSATMPPPPSLAMPTLGPPSGEQPSPFAPASVPLYPPPASNYADVPNDADVNLVAPNFKALASGMNIPNAAGLSMQILPGAEIAPGSRVSFVVSSKKAGYLILIDVDSTGKIAQIYPNPMSLMAPGGVPKKSNYLRPGRVLALPDQDNPYSGFEFVASPSSGTAMVVALLSEHPVQLVDLPDVPGNLRGGVSAVDYLVNIANQLRIPDAADASALADAHWSFDVKTYAVR